MKASNLLPYYVRRFGWIALFPSVLLGIMVMYFEFEIPGFEIMIPYNDGLFNEGPSNNNLTNELVSLLVLASLFLISFSEEKVEDEWVSKVRLESLQWAVYANYGLLIVAILFVYDVHFFEALVYNMYTIMVFFIVRFNYALHVKFNPGKIERHEK
jgi:hypothetical protein